MKPGIEIASAEDGQKSPSLTKKSPVKVPYQINPKGVALLPPQEMSISERSISVGVAVKRAMDIMDSAISTRPTKLARYDNNEVKSDKNPPLTDFYREMHASSVDFINFSSTTYGDVIPPHMLKLDERHTPLDVSAFLSRVDTYDLRLWSTKPDRLCSFQCARYGWRIAGTNTLVCVSCRSTLSVPQDHGCMKLCDWTTNIEKQIQRTGHLSDCIWVKSPSPHNILQLPEGNDMQIYMNLAAASYTKMQTLPVFSARYRMIMGAIDLSGLKIKTNMKLLQNLQGATVGLSEDIALFLMMNGWTMDGADVDAIKCHLCLRQVPLWLCLPTPSNKSIQDMVSPPNSPYTIAQSNIKELDPVTSHWFWCPWRKFLQPVDQVERMQDFLSNEGTNLFVSENINKTFDKKKPDVYTYMRLAAKIDADFKSGRLLFGSTFEFKDNDSLAIRTICNVKDLLNSAVRSDSTQTISVRQSNSGSKDDIDFLTNDIMSIKINTNVARNLFNDEGGENLIKKRIENLEPLRPIASVNGDCQRDKNEMQDNLALNDEKTIAEPSVNGNSEKIQTLEESVLEMEHDKIPSQESNPSDNNLQEFEEIAGSNNTETNFEDGLPNFETSHSLEIKPREKSPHATFENAQNLDSKDISQQETQPLINMDNCSDYDTLADVVDVLGGSNTACKEKLVDSQEESCVKKTTDKVVNETFDMEFCRSENFEQNLEKSPEIMPEVETQIIEPETEIVSENQNTAGIGECAEKHDAMDVIQQSFDDENKVQQDFDLDQMNTVETSEETDVMIDYGNQVLDNSVSEETSTKGIEESLDFELEKLHDLKKQELDYSVAEIIAEPKETSNLQVVEGQTQDSENGEKCDLENQVLDNTVPKETPISGIEEGQDSEKDRVEDPVSNTYLESDEKAGDLENEEPQNSEESFHSEHQESYQHSENEEEQNSENEEEQNSENEEEQNSENEEEQNSENEEKQNSKNKKVHGTKQFPNSDDEENEASDSEEERSSDSDEAIPDSEDDENEEENSKRVSESDSDDSDIICLD